MEFIIIWFALCVIPGVIASNKGRSGFGFFVLSVFFSPLIGLIAALIAKKNTEKIENSSITSGESRKCPHCAELVKREAKICKHCGKDLPDPGPIPSKSKVECLVCHRINPSDQGWCTGCGGTLSNY